MTDRPRRPGRPAGDGTDGRRRILAAARTTFADKGFDATSMRTVASSAGVDVALIAHHFGNKQGLFAATLELPEEAQSILAEALDGPVRSQGRRLTQAYLDLWESPATGPQMRAVARTAIGNAEALAHLQLVLLGITGRPEVERLLAGRRTGFFLAMSHLVGTAILRYVVALPPLADLDLATVVDRVAPAVQRHLSTPDS